MYGKALAEQGFVVIAYDASYQGESGGAPRWVESLSQRVADVSHVIDYAVTLPYVDADRVGGIGICGGGGYILNAALTEKRIKAVVGITPVNIGRLFREGFSQYEPLGALNGMAAQRTSEARGGELQVNELLPASPEAAAAAGMTERDVAEATDYYKTPRGQQPGGATRMLFSHAQQTLAWDAFNFSETLMTQPMMVVIGQKVVPSARIATGWRPMAAPQPRKTASWCRCRTGRTTTSTTSPSRSHWRWNGCCRS